MKEGIRMMEANNWPRLTPVMRHQREAGEAGLRPGLEGLGRAQGRQCGHGAGAGPHHGRPEGRDMWLNRKGNFGHFGISVEKCRIQRNVGRGRRMVRRDSRRRKMDGVRMFGRDDSRHGGCDEERGGDSPDGGQGRRGIGRDVVRRGRGVEVDRGRSGRNVVEMMVDLVSDRRKGLYYYRPGLVMV